jgi:hypothetical protein
MALHYITIQRTAARTVQAIQTDKNKKDRGQDGETPERRGRAAIMA